MPLPEEPREGIFRESEKTDTVNNMDEVYELDGTVTMLLRVVAPQTPETIDEILKRPRT